MRYDLKHPSQEPVLWSSIVKDGLFIALGGLAVFNVFTPNDDQMAWLLTAFGFISMVVAVALRETVYSSAKVEEQFLDAETIMNADRDLNDPTAVVDETDVDYSPEPEGDSG